MIILCHYKRLAFLRVRANSCKTKGLSGRRDRGCGQFDEKSLGIRRFKRGRDKLGLGSLAIALPISFCSRGLTPSGPHVAMRDSPRPARSRPRCFRGSERWKDMRSNEWCAKPPKRLRALVRATFLSADLFAGTGTALEHERNQSRLTSLLGAGHFARFDSVRASGTLQSTRPHPGDRFANTPSASCRRERGGRTGNGITSTFCIRLGFPEHREGNWRARASLAWT